MFIDAIRALRAGQELASAETWKKVQVWTNSAIVLIGSLVSLSAAVGHPIPITADQISTLVTGLAVLVGMYNTYTTVATTKRLGVRPAAVGDNTGVPDATANTAVSGEWIRELDGGRADDVPVLNDRVER